MSRPRPALYKGFRFPPEIISRCVWLYFRFGVSPFNMSCRAADQLDNALERLIADSRYGRLDDVGRVRAVERILGRVQRETSEGLRRELPDP